MVRWSERPQAAVPLTVLPHHVLSHFLGDLPLIFPLTSPISPLQAVKAASDGEKGAFDPASHEWQKPGEGRRKGSRSEESRAINLSHEHVPLTSGLATPG